MNIQSIHRISRMSGVVAIEYALVAAGIAGIVALYFANDTGNFAGILSGLFGKISSAA